MPYVKAVFAGVGTAIGAAVSWILVSFILPVFGPMVIGRILNRGGTSAAVIGSRSVLLAAFIGFALGTWWGVSRFVAAH